jgi:hypothetical protein
VLGAAVGSVDAGVAPDERAPARRDLSLALVMIGGEALDVSRLTGWYVRHGLLRRRR